MTRASNKALMFASELHVERGGEEIAGPARFELLRKIDECGSITAAAQAAGISYRTAWLAVDALNNLAGEVLVERLKGGAGGGGARLSDAGRRLLDTYANIQARQQEFLAWLSRGGTDIEHYVQMLSRLSLRTSARNQLAARVRKCDVDGPTVTVALRLADGQEFRAHISKRSQQMLGVNPGTTVIALFKINAAVLSLARDATLHGVVAQTEEIDGRFEVTVSLPGGATVHSLAVPARGDVVPAVGEAAHISVDPDAILLAVSE